MATRLYLSNGLVPDIIPGIEANWEKTSGYYRYKCSPIKQGTAWKEVSNYETNVAVNYDTLIVQFVSDPLQTQTINGTVKGQILARESLAAADLNVAMIIKVVTPVGLTRGVLLSYFPDPIDSELSATSAPVNVECPPAATALTELVIEDGDRLVIEFGFRAFNVATTTYTAYLTIGDGAATDLPEDTVETEYLNPWIEFSDSLVFQSETNLVATGGWALSSVSALGDSSTDVTNFVADTASPLGFGFALYGDCRIEDVPPAQFVGDGYIGLFGPCAIDSILPGQSATQLAAAGYIALSGVSVIDSTLPTDNVTALVATGHYALSSKCVLGDEHQLGASRTDFVATGGYKLSGTIALTTIQPANKVTALAASGRYAFGCACVIDSPSPVATVHALAGTISYVLGGQAASGVILPLVTNFIATGGYILGSPGVDPEETVFEAWVLNGQAFEPSIFSAFRFNSFAQRGVQTFAAGEDGIYLLGGDDDDGEVFHTGARIGPANFGSDREKRMRGIQMGNCGPDTKVRVAAKDGKEGVFTPDIDPSQIVVSRDIQGREFTIDLMDFQELSQFEATVLMLARR